jgi:LDH2 family malate/lactate/ureidoglycolate dehydrogenase
MFGTNPLSVAIPCGDEPTYVLDMSTSVVPVNRVEMMQEQGQSIPLGWCLDAAGRPTSDPGQAAIFLPLGGTRELGAHKGFGLAMLVEVLTALLSTGWAPTSGETTAGSRPAYHQERIAHFFGAIRIDLFRAADAFRQAMDAMIDSLHRAQPAPGHERIFVPGEIEHDTQRIRSRQGIPLSRKDVDNLRCLSQRYGLALNLSHS